jgi:hypothetical protein
VHPLNQQCEARAKATGRRCERRVVGGAVCFVHGGNAKQVKAKREQRVLVAEARAAAPSVVMAEPEEILITALHDTNATLQAIKAQLWELSVSAEAARPVMLDLIGDWLDRVARIGKVVIDGQLVEKLERRVGVQARDLASQLTALLAAVVAASPLSAQQKLALWESRFDGLQAVADERAPFRLSGDALRRFGDGLMEAAAREQALAEGVVWGDDSSEPDEESDEGLDEVGSLVLFPSFDGNGFRG